MKKIVIIMLWALISLNVLAHDDQSSTLNERFYQAKLKELVYRLHITDSQKKKFEPIYRSYCEEMRALWNERKAPIRPGTSGDAAAIAKRKMEMQQRAQGIRIKYIDRFAIVLNAHQVDRLYEVESIIQQKLKERQNKARGQ